MSVYEKVLSFKRKYPLTIAWRLKSHAKVIEKHLNPGEEVIYAFAAQKNYSPLDIFRTSIFTLTNKRMLIASKRLFFGYSYIAITPDLFNDLTIRGGIIWGQVTLDTVKELVIFNYISKRALDDIETSITEKVMKEKKKYQERIHQEERDTKQ